MIDINTLIDNTKDLTLLYVEDNNDTRESTLILFEDLFDTIIVAVDGQDGIEKYKQNSIDLVITDISMPYIDGLEMCKMIKEIDEDQSIIIITALTDICKIKEAIEIGVDSFLNKPLDDMNLLFHKLNKVVKKINYEKNEKEMIKAQQDEEKAQLVFKMIKNISHHWRQPLSVISIIASHISYKIDNDMEITEDDLQTNNKIVEKTTELSTVLEKLENLEYENISLKEIEDIISISNPIYRRK